MPKGNIQLLPLIASIGIGTAAYSMMTGRGGQIEKVIPLAGAALNQVARKERSR
jgi:hypothetical protein